MSSRRLATALALVMLVPFFVPLFPNAAAASFGTGAPQFILYPGPPGLSAESGEPSIGINPITGAILMPVENYVPLNLPPRMSIASINFDDSVDPPVATWIDATNQSPGSRGNVDPILYTDRVSGRTWAGGLDGTCSILGMTDNDGRTWEPVGNACVATLDHETIGSGPFAEPKPPTALYHHALYYCAQAVAVTCVVSYDGGLTFPITSQVPCEGDTPGFHGSVEVGPDGTAWLPFGQRTEHHCIAKSTDNGLTWTDIVLEPRTAAGGFDPDLAISPSGWVYYGYSAQNGRAHVALSKDGGASWSYSPPLGAESGYDIKTTTFHEMVVGDDQRAALAFLGTSATGPATAFSSTAFTGVWYLYVSFTYDGGQTWQTVRASDDPFQRGMICDGGPGCPTSRNLLDFMDAQVDAKGRVVVGLADGCTSVACRGPSGTVSQSQDSKATIVRQTYGRGLYAAHDAGSIAITSLPPVGAVGVPVVLQANVNLKAPYDITLNWGDGTVETLNGQSGGVLARSHPYASAGDFTISISGQGSDGQTAIASREISIADGPGGVLDIVSPSEGDKVGDLVTVTGTVGGAGNLPPTAAFDFTPSGLTVAFDASASSDPDGDALAFSWLFGDGATGSGATPSHTYTSPGSYQVCLTVSDGGLSANLCRDVTLQAQAVHLITDDPEGDEAANSFSGQPVPSVDILRLEATKSQDQEPVFILTLKDVSVQPPPGEAAVGLHWMVEWKRPSGVVDYVQYVSSLDSGGAVTQRCSYGTITETGGQRQLNQGGSTTCSHVAGPNGKVFMMFPASSLGGAGYTANTLLTGVTATAGTVIGLPRNAALTAEGSTEYDTTSPTDYQLQMIAPKWEGLGMLPVRAAKPAPTQPPADPEVTDKVSNPVGDNTPHLNVQSAWFDADAKNLYVGLKIQDIPADATTTAFTYYAVNFKPTYAVEDPSWGGEVTGTTTFTGLRAFALYSPVRAHLGCCIPPSESDPPGPPTSDSATVFELQILTRSGTSSVFGTLGIVDGSVDANTDIIWWTIPRSLLQFPLSGALIEETSAATAPAVGGAVTLGTAFGDATGTGRAYAFPFIPVDPPVVTLAADPIAGLAPLSVTFTHTITPSSVREWTMEFGDGTSQTGSGSPPASFSHVYDGVGMYVARLTVTAPDGGVGIGQASVDVGSPPTGTRVLVHAIGGGVIEATCTDGCATWSAELDLSSFATGAVTIVAQLERNGEIVSADSVGVTLERIVPLAVTIDTPSDGAEVPPGTLRIAGRVQGSTDQRPVAHLSADRDAGLAPLEVTFTLDGSDDVGIASWRFNTGDGRVIDGTTLPTQVVHTYQTAGNYNVAFTVRDTRGAIDTYAAVIRVQAQNQPPTVPHSPSPADGATGIQSPVALSWAAEDPDGNTLTYDVYVDGNLVATGQTAGYLLGGLAASTTYTWSVVASDGMAQTPGPTWSFTTAAPPATEADKPHVVVAVIDSGINPYHQQFRRANLVDHPATYLSGFPATATQVNLCFFDPLTKSVDQSRCPAGMLTAAANDKSEWQKIGYTPTGQTGANQGKLAWFPGTNVMLISFGHDGDQNYPGLDGSLGADDEHGTLVASNVNGLTTGSCPECIVVMVENDASLDAAYAWASNQPWVDVVSSSVRSGVGGINPGDVLSTTSQSVKNAVTKGKIVVESSGNGVFVPAVGSLGTAPTTTYINPHGNPWGIPVGCSAPNTGQTCIYHDFPNPITAVGVARHSAIPDSWSGTDDVGGTSFSTPSAAGVIGRSLLAARTAMNDLTEGPLPSGTKSLLRVGAGKTAPAQGPFADGSLTRLELEEVLFKTARRSILPQVPGVNIPSLELVNSPVNFIKEGYGDVYRGAWGVGHGSAVDTWSSSADMTAVILGQKEVPRRWLEETWWEQIAEPIQIQIYGADVPDTDADAFPRNDPQDNNFEGYTGDSQASLDLPIRANVPIGNPPTASNKRLFLHHANLGPNPANPVNDIIDYYLNSVSNPSISDPDADDSGFGATGANANGLSRTYTVKYPDLGGPVLLDRTQDIAVHVEAVRFGGDAPGPATPLTVTFTLKTGDTVVGSGVANNDPRSDRSIYHATFKPQVDAISDPVTLTVAWPGPIYSIHVLSQGASWMDVPVKATLPPASYDAVTYYVDDFDATYGSNGDTVVLTRDASRLQGDANAGFTFNLPQAQGAIVNMEAEDALVTSDAILGSSGSFRFYPCTWPSGSTGAEHVTVKVAFRVGHLPIAEGSVTQIVAGPHTVHSQGIVVPLAVRPIIVPPGEKVFGSVVVSGPGGAFTHNMGICGGGPDRPITLSLSTASLAASPAATVGALPDPLTGTVTVSGTADFPVVPEVANVKWFAKDMDDWDTDGQQMTLDTGGPGEGSGGPIFEPDLNGIKIVFRSARPVAQDAPRLAADGVAVAQMWATSVIAATDVTVDMVVYLDGPGGQRVLGSGSATRHVIAPVLDFGLLGQEAYVISFTPTYLDPKPDEHLVMVATIRNAGSASTSHVSSMGGGEDMPIFVSLPKDATPVPTSPVIDLTLGELVRTVPVVNGAWSTDVDTRTLANGDATLTATPRALYDGTPRTGEAVTRAVTISNIQVNTPPTAGLALTPTIGVAPLQVTASLTGTDQQTPNSALAWTVSWGDGTPDSTGVGLPVNVEHTYGVGMFTATLTVTDAGGMIATATDSVEVLTPPPVEKVVLIINGAAPIDVVDDSSDGSYSSWHADVDLTEAGMHAIVARLVRGDDTLVETRITVTVVLPNIPVISILSPIEGARIASGTAIMGTVDYRGDADGVLVSLDPDFGTSVAATSSDGFDSWSAPIDALALPEDEEATIYARALTQDGTSDAFVTVTLDAAPNARMLVTGAPAFTGTPIQFEDESTPAKSGAAIVSFAWTLGDGATSTAASFSHAYADDGVYTVTLTVTDALGRSNETSRQVSIVNRAPQITTQVTPDAPTTLDTVTIESSATDADGVIATIETTVYNGPTKGNGVLATGGAILSLQFPDDGTYLVEVRATDDDGASTLASGTIEVFNILPTAALMASPLLVGTDDPVTFDARGSADPDGSIVSYRFDLGDGTIVTQTQPTLAHRYTTGGEYEARVTVTDDDGATRTSDAVTIRVNTRPVLKAIGNKVIPEDDTLAFTVEATDAENDPLTFGYDVLPEGATFNTATGQFSWTTNFGSSGNYPVNFSVTDGVSSDKERIIISVGNVNRPPTLATIGPKDGVENSLLTFSLSASDPDLEPLTFSATNMPAGATLHPTTGLFAWTPNFTQSGFYDVTFRVSDGDAALDDTETVRITIANLNRAPVLQTFTPTASILQLSTLEIPVRATDADGDTMTWTVAGLNGQPVPGATMRDDGNGRATLVWTPSLQQLGAYTLRVEVSDSDLVASQQVVVTVVFKTDVTVVHETAPVLYASPGDVVKLAVRVTNTGPQTDTFTIDALDSLSNWPVDEIPAPIELASGESRIVSVNVTVPEDGVKGIKTLYAISQGDNGLTSRSARFTIHVPVEIDRVVLERLFNVSHLPRGFVYVDHIDGSAAKDALVTVTQISSTLPTQGGSTRTTVSGTTDEEGVFFFDFTREAGAMVPGDHQLTVTAQKPNGLVSTFRMTYSIPKPPNLV